MRLPKRLTVQFGQVIAVAVCMVEPVMESTPKVDNMGRGYIVYWPEIAGEGEDKE